MGISTCDGPSNDKRSKIYLLIVPVNPHLTVQNGKTGNAVLSIENVKKPALECNVVKRLFIQPF